MTAELPSLPPRDPSGHKGTFGTVSVIGGCAGDPRMIGAPALVARGALRAGAGLARLVMPAPVLDAGLVIEPSATGRALPTDASGRVVPHEAAATIDEVTHGSDCVAVGPGLGAGAEIESLALRAVAQDGTPVVVDADALNALSRVPDLARELRARAILTPHSGEFKRLAESVSVPAPGADAGSRTEAAGELARRLGAIVVLKGAGTVVSDGHRSWTCPTGHACLATAGTGDVLSGVIAGLVAQFVAPAPPAGLSESMRERLPAVPGRPLSLYDAACLAVWAHGRAGELWAERHGGAGLLARELCDGLPAAFDELRG